MMVGASAYWSDQPRRSALDQRQGRNAVVPSTFRLVAAPPQWSAMWPKGSSGWIEHALGRTAKWPKPKLQQRKPRGSKATYGFSCKSQKITDWRFHNERYITGRNHYTALEDVRGAERPGRKPGSSPVTTSIGCPAGFNRLICCRQGRNHNQTMLLLQALFGRLVAAHIGHGHFVTGHGHLRMFSLSLLSTHGPTGNGIASI